MDYANNYPIQQELYFLIAKFLETGPCHRTLEALKEELAQHKIIPKRLDWEGNEHEQTFKELENKNTHIGPWHLLNICRRLGPFLDKEIKPSVPGIHSLLGAGRQSLLRSRDNQKKSLSLVHFSVRRHGCAVQSPIYCAQHNIVQVLYGRETSGPLSRRHAITPKLYSKTHLLNRTLGHLSAVYCLLFDRTGRYIVTGADDLLVKIWSAVDGRLLSTFRGASAEITDIAINVGNTLLAAGSLDRMIKVWCLQTAFPVASLSGHTGTITAVNFCPNPVNDVHYLVSTSSDGSVAFWSYTMFCDGPAIFQPKPVQYHEKMRPGQAQMLCAKFSVGGMFLAAGSADHHVRVYCMNGETPQRVMEMEKHTDRVDSIQWANKSLKFISGSKDGTAIIWYYRAQHWHSKQLLMSTSLNGNQATEEENKLKLKVTMVTWSADDCFVITAVNDHSLKVWSPLSGELLRILKAHKFEVYVLESHPLDSVLLSAGHDGVIILWNLLNGETLTTYENYIEGQGNGAVFDAKWSPDGTMIAATDSHGHLLMFGLSAMSDKMKHLPKELFFHTDYRPLVRDSLNNVLDEQTQVPPHLMPPPFLVDIDGNPYPPNFQRLVPGRQHCSQDQLIPNIIFTAGGQQEVIQGVGETRSNIDQMIQQLAGRSRNQTLESSLRIMTSPRSRINMRLRGDIEGVRQSSGNWQRDGMDWKQGVLITPLSPWVLSTVLNKIHNFAEVELDEYLRESKRVAEVIPETPIVPLNRRVHRRNLHSYRTRAAREQQLQDEGEDDGDQNSSSPLGDSSDLTAHSEDMLTSSSSESSSTEYSDWVADHGVTLEPPQRSRRRKKRVRPPPALPPKPTPRKAPPQPPSTSTPSTSTAAIPGPSTAAPNAAPTEIPELYRPSEWLAEVIPKKFPYYPQMGDEVMFFAQGYKEYLKAVSDKNFYKIADSQLKPWGKLGLNEPEFVKIIGIKYELRPPRLCCLRLAVIKQNGRISGDRFTIKYHDIPDVIDFFVLKQTYDTAMGRKWKTGDRFRSMIDDGWWWGTIESRQPHSISAFLCHRIKWDNGESEGMSPWDMEPVDPAREPEPYGGSVPVLPEEIAAILYHPRGDEWPGGDRDTACTRIISGLEEIMGLSIAEPFIAPVDINMYPTYAYIVEFPIDLSTIMARFENRFYRRVTAAQFDIRYLAMNAEKFNGPHSSIVKQARIITDLCLRICKDYNIIDVPLLYRQLIDAYQSSASESDDITAPSTSTRERAAASRSLRAMRRANHHQPDWRRDCKQLLDVLWNCQDSEPFKEPVDRLEHPDYDKVIDTPMDLGTIREELRGGNYSSPLEFCKDVRMIFSNSRNFNTNKRSKIYVMTVRLSAMAEEHMKRIIQNWKASCRRQNRSKISQNAASRRRKTTVSYCDDRNTSSGEDSDFISKKVHPRLRGKANTEVNDRGINQGESSKMSNGILRLRNTTKINYSNKSTSEDEDEDDSIEKEDKQEDSENNETYYEKQSVSVNGGKSWAGVKSIELRKRNLPNKTSIYKEENSSSEEGSTSSSDSSKTKSRSSPNHLSSARGTNARNVNNTQQRHVTKRAGKKSSSDNDDDSSSESSDEDSQTKNCKRRGQTIYNTRSSKEAVHYSPPSPSSTSSSSSENDIPTRNWTMNGHVRVLRPVVKKPTNSEANAAPKTRISSKVVQDDSNQSPVEDGQSPIEEDQSLNEDGQSPDEDEQSPDEEVTSKEVERSDGDDDDYEEREEHNENNSESENTLVSANSSNSDSNSSEDVKTKRILTNKSRKRPHDSDSDFGSDGSWRNASGSQTRKSIRPKRSVKKQNYAPVSEESDNETQVRPRRTVQKQHYQDSNGSSDNSNSETPKISISSRGRIRKITARARAFLRE